MKRRVVSAEMLTGRSPINPNLPSGAIWRLRLECGHYVERRLRYPHKEGFRGGWYNRRSTDEALPPPQFCKCEHCRKRGEMTIKNGMNEEEYARQVEVHNDLSLINGVVGIEHQAWDDRYIANIDADLLIELVTTFNFLYAQIKRLDSAKMRMMVAGQHLTGNPSDDPEAARQKFIDVMARADELVTRINKGVEHEAR